VTSIIIVYAALAFAQLQAAPTAPVAPATIEAAAAPASAATLRLPALTPVRLRVIGEISSKTHVKGDKVEIILAEPLRLSDTLAIPAGTRGVAEVIHAAKGGMGGKAGELLVAARSLDLSPDLHIPLRSFRLAPASGKNNEGLAMGLSIAGGVAGGIAAMVMTGGSARIPDRSEAFAKTAADVDIPAAQLQPAATAPATTSTL
jgi:hypothetical protein